MRIPLSLTVAVLLTSSPTQAAAEGGVVRSMTPENIEKALALGKAQKPPAYRLSNPRVWVQFDTPFWRVARKAAEARERSMAVEPELATPDAVAPELRVSVGPEPVGDSTPGVKAVTIVSASGAKVMPTSSAKFTDAARSKHGKISLKGVKLVFPIAALEPGASFHVQMENNTEHVFKPEPAWFNETR